MSTPKSALDHVRAVADAVLYEGYALYPHRFPAARNQARRELGLLVPPSSADAGRDERSACRAECLAEMTDPDAELGVCVRFLQAQRRTMEARTSDGLREAGALTVAGERLLTCDEAVEREHTVVLALENLLHGERVVPITVPGGEQLEEVPDGRVVRRRQPLTAELRCRVETLPSLVRLRVVVANTSAVDCSAASRPETMRHSLIATHVVLSLRGARFLSQVNPPRWAAQRARECVNDHMWPVLVGRPGSRDTMLACPVMLDDYPDADPRTRVGLHDAREFDELLTLRAFTDEDSAAGAGIPGQDADLAPAVPEQRGDPLPGRVRVGEREIGPGSKVVLRPARSGDAQDMFVAGRTGTVQEVLIDVDGTPYVAVTVDGDPAQEWQLVQGRYRYFTVAEVEPCPDGEPS